MVETLAPKVDDVALKKATDDAVAANIKILENFYSFLISLALTQATMKLIDGWLTDGLKVETLGAVVLYLSLLVTIVPFYQGMSRFLYVTHVVRPIEKPNFQSSPMLLDIYVFLLMSCIIFAMGRFLNDPTTFFYLWSALLVVDILWVKAVWKIQKGETPIWARNNLLWICVAWIYWALIHLTCLPSILMPSAKNILPYGFVLFEIARTVRDYQINWNFYFPPKYKGF
jgi:hypothetical protein